MDVLSFLRTVAALGCVLGLLAGALFAVRRYNIALPGQTGGRTGRRLALVERVGIDGKRSVILIRRDDREHLIMVAPEGQTVIETNIVHQPAEAETDEVAVVEAPAARIQQDLAMLAALAGRAVGKAQAALARARAPKTPLPEATGDASTTERTTAGQPEFAALVDRLGTAGAKAKAALSRSPRQRVAAAPIPAEAKAKPKRAPVRLKVTAPDGRTIVEPTPVAARAPVAQAA